jgi:hypothetical protein
VETVPTEPVSLRQHTVFDRLQWSLTFDTLIVLRNLTGKYQRRSNSSRQ